MARTGESKEEIKSNMISYYPDLADMSIAKLKASGYGLNELGNMPRQRSTSHMCFP